MNEMNAGMKVWLKMGAMAVGVLLCFAVVASGEATGGLTATAKLLTAVDSAEVSAPADSFVAVESMPEMLTQVSPVYPKEEREKGIEADVWIKALVGSSGNVLKAMTMKSEGVPEPFLKAALDAALQNRFKPAVAKGKPVAVWVTYRVNFVLSDKGAAPQQPDPKK
jgi:TonB family protein